MDVARVGGQVGAIQVHPHRGFAVEWAFDVVGLVGDHLTDANDEVSESLRGGPMIAHADGRRFDIRMKDRRQHLTFRALAGIVPGELNLHEMLLARDRLTAVASRQAADVILDGVVVWRVARCGHDLDQREILKDSSHLLGIGHQATDADGKLWWSGLACGRVRCAASRRCPDWYLRVW